MIGLERIFKLSRKLASSILNGDGDGTQELQSSFSKKDKDYILKDLTVKEKVLERKRLRKELDAGKEGQFKLITATNKRKFGFGYAWRIAAVFMMMLGISYFFYNQLVKAPQEEMAVKDNVISLRLEDGRILEIDPNKNTLIKGPNEDNVIKQVPGTLKYAQKNNLGIAVYNELYVPYGKIYAVELSDGTLVHLNAGSSLRYPVNFVRGRPREVYLTGEAFFSVTKDSLQPFYVFSDGLGVKVLGTKFNISSYQGDPDISTVLSEGSVRIYSLAEPGNATLLTPGHKASWDRGQKNISVSEVDVRLYTGWINGEMVFKSMPFERIVEKLERSYNVEIVNNDRKLNKEIFTATFHVDIESIEKVLDYIKLERHFNYTMTNNKIIINP